MILSTTIGFILTLVIAFALAALFDKYNKLNTPKDWFILIVGSSILSLSIFKLIEPIINLFN